MKLNNAVEQSLRYLITGFIIIIGLVMIISSGGGGGDGEAESEDSLSYTGSTEMAVIDADNAIELTVGAHVAGPVFTGPGRVAVDRSYEKKSFIYDGASLYLRSMSKGIEAFRISVEVAPELRSIHTHTDTLYGNCGGSLTLTEEHDHTTGNFTGTRQYDNYCEDGETTSGTVYESGYFDLTTFYTVYNEMYYSQLTVTSAIGSVTMSGTTSINYSANSRLRTINDLIRDNGTGKVYKIENYVESFVQGTGGVKRTYSSGRYYHPNYGYVDVKSAVPYMYYFGDAGPSSGELIITGDLETKASLMALTPTTFEVTADTNGDGTFDWSSRILHWLGDGGSSLSYTGSTEMAVITADNAIELARGALFGGPVIEVITNLGVGPEFNGEVVNGNCGGNATLTVDSMDSTSGAFTGTAEFYGYCEDGETVSGTVNLSGTVDVTTIEQDLLQMDASFNPLTVTSSSGSVTLSGSTSIDHSTDPDVMTANYLIRDNSTGKVYKVENYVVSIQGELDGVELTYSSGRYYHPDYGFVEIESAVPFMYYFGDAGPSSGELIITGGMETKASLMALNSTTFEVTADTDGDGTFEWSSGIHRWSPGNTAPFANAGSDQVVTTGSVVQLDGSSSFDIDGDELSFSWTLKSRPISSSAVLSDPQIVNPTFIADVEGDYVLNLLVNDGGVDSTVTQVTVTAQKDIVMLSFQVRDAEYNKQLDRLIMVSDTPANRLHIHDPLTGTDTVVDLPLPPTSVSVGPDGLHAAVGHDGWISYINLVTATLEKTFAVSTDVLDIVLAGNGYVYAFPRRDQWEYIRCVNIATEVETLSTGMQIRAGTLAKLHPFGTSIYGADNGLSPSDIEKYDISSGTATYLYDSPYHGDYAMCGDLWLSEDGLRVFTKCGNVFSSSTVQSEDMLYNGSLSNTARITHLSHSAITKKVIAIPGPTSGMEDTELHIYDYDFLNFDTAVTLPSFIISGQDYPAHGKYVFFSADETIYFAIIQADTTAGLLYSFGIVRY